MNSSKSIFLKNRLQSKNLKHNGFRQDLSTSTLTKPLFKKSFYLDIKSYKWIHSLTEDISRLGGILETFLSKDVTYVITDKMESKRIDSNSTRKSSTHSPLTSTQSPSFPEMYSPLTPLTSNEEKPKICLSRGEALLEKAIKLKANCVGSTDVLHNAHMLGVEVISLNKFLDWLFKYKSKHPVKEHKRTKSVNDNSVIYLHSPCIKYESLDRSYKPVYKQLQKWPELNLEKYTPSSPFSMDISLPTLSPKEKIETQSSQSEYDDDTTDNSSKSFCQKSKRIGPVEKFRRKHGYCEICSVHYNNLYKHVESDKHRQFVNNKNNFRALDEIMATSRGLSTFLLETKLQNEENMNIDAIQNVGNSS